MEDTDGLLNYVLGQLPDPKADGFTERLEEISKGADVPFHTLLKIAKRETADPRVSTVQNLIRYFQQREQARAA